MLHGGAGASADVTFFWPGLLLRHTALSLFVLSAAALVATLPAVLLLVRLARPPDRNRRRKKQEKEATPLDGAWRLVSSWDSRSKQSSGNCRKASR